MIPIARTENLLVQDLDNECIIYDPDRNVANCLSPIAKIIWNCCDGKNTVKDITQFLVEELDLLENEDIDWQALVLLTLEELEQYYLIQGYLNKSTNLPDRINHSHLSRRNVIKAASFVGGLAVATVFPSVKSVAAPTAAMATPAIVESPPPAEPPPTSPPPPADPLPPDPPAEPLPTEPTPPTPL